MVGSIRGLFKWNFVSAAKPPNLLQWDCVGAVYKPSWYRSTCCLVEVSSMDQEYPIMGYYASNNLGKFNAGLEV
jgi:hypothetical protein